LHHQTAALLVENIVVNVPGAIHGNLAAKLVNIVQPFEYGCIRVGTELIAVDGVVGIARGHLVVTRIGKRLAVGYQRHAPQGLIAENLPMLGDSAPQKGEQQRAPLGCARPPIALSQILVGYPAPAFLVVQQILFRAGEDLLPAQSIAHDQYHGLRLVRRQRDRVGGFGGVRHPRQRHEDAQPERSPRHWCNTTAQLAVQLK
jgi:hypothetical protein